MACKIRFTGNSVEIDGPNSFHLSTLGSEIIDLFECDMDFMGNISEELGNSAAPIIHGIYGEALSEKQKTEITESAKLIKEYAGIFLGESSLIDEYSSLSPIDRYSKLNVFNNCFVKCNITFDKTSKTKIETYQPESFIEACYVIFIKMIEFGVTIKKCGNCNKYFLKRAGYNNEYCRRPIPEKPGKTCQDLGALIKYRSDPDHIKKVYNRSYKRHDALKRNGKMTQKKFNDWLKKAQKLRKDARINNVSEKEFNEQLDKISFKLIG